MFNNINDSNKDVLYNSQLSNLNNVINLASVRANLQKNNAISNPYVDKTEISSNAMELFQRDLDINKFTKIATSNPEDTSHLEKMKELFNEGVVDVYEDDVLSELDNSRQDYLLNKTENYQVFITCCEESNKEQLKNGRVFKIDRGKVRLMSSL